MTTIDSLDISRAILEDREHRSIMKAAVPAPRSRRATWNDAIRKLVSLGKSFPGDEVDDSIDFDSEIADGINANYVSRVPSRAEIPLSPTTSASGAGAEQLPKWSSDPATQSGITELYRRFSAMMEQFSELKKSQMDVIESVTNLAKATKAAAFPDSESEDEDEDTEELEKSDKIGKALHGAGLARGTIREVLSVLASSRHGSSPPDFAAYTLKKASAQEVDFDSLTSEQLIKYQSAKQMLGAAASGVNINHDLLDQAARVVANPTGGV